MLQFSGAYHQPYIFEVMKMIAIYARKSVFREDSVSIETQIEMCKYETKGEEYFVYSDNGYSGKDTSRPDFQRLTQDIKNGRINKVIVYKLDRISRSILDFSNLMDLFQKHNVDFISATEHFDTSSPMGRAMLNICIVFAQLERETIQQRVADAYASRSKKGFFMGGKLPYGFRLKPITIDGKKTSMYEEVPEEMEEVKWIFDMFSVPSATLGDIMKKIKEKNMQPNRRGAFWNAAKLSIMLRNPSYTSATIDIYNFFKEQRTQMVNSPEEFCGETSMYLFQGENSSHKTWDLVDRTLVIAPHQGIIDPEIWLACRKKLLAHHRNRNCKPKNSFLSGKIKCAYCGYSLRITISARKKTDDVRYFIDSGKFVYHICDKKLPTLKADDVELLVFEEMVNKIETLDIHSETENLEISNEEIELKTKIETIQRSIENLMVLVASGTSEITAKYINEKIMDFDKEKNGLQSRLDALYAKTANKTDYKKIKNVMSKWSEISFDEKRDVVEMLIQRISISAEETTIDWNI